MLTARSNKKHYSMPKSSTLFLQSNFLLGFFFFFIIKSFNQGSLITIGEKVNYSSVVNATIDISTSTVIATILRITNIATHDRPISPRPHGLCCINQWLVLILLIIFVPSQRHCCTINWYNLTWRDGFSTCMLTLGFH